MRIAVDSKRMRRLAEIRKQTKAESVRRFAGEHRPAELVAPHVDKVRYNPAIFITTSQAARGRTR